MFIVIHLEILEQCLAYQPCSGSGALKSRAVRHPIFNFPDLTVQKKGIPNQFGNCR